MSKKSLVLVVVLMILTIINTGCTGKSVIGDTNKPVDGAGANYPITITDGLGNSVIIEKLPERIISIAPSQTEILYALGLEDKVIAVSDYCDYPIEANEKEKVGSSWATNTERIIELEPDLVFVYGEGQPEAIEQMVAVGITVVKYEPESVDAILDTILLVGEIAGEVNKAETLVNEMKSRRDDIINKVKSQPKKRVFYQVWDEPLSTAGPGSFIHELIQLAGGENIAGDAMGAWPLYSVEALVEKDPEFFLAPAHVNDNMNLSPEEEQQLINSIKSRAGYEGITAVINNQIELLEPNIMSRPGARIIDALELLAKTIHPELF